MGSGTTEVATEGSRDLSYCVVNGQTASKWFIRRQPFQTHDITKFSHLPTKHGYNVYFIAHADKEYLQGC